jgi:hypothetical protein
VSATFASLMKGGPVESAAGARECGGMTLLLSHSTNSAMRRTVSIRVVLQSRVVIPLLLHTASRSAILCLGPQSETSSTSASGTASIAAMIFPSRNRFWIASACSQ